MDKDLELKVISCFLNNSENCSIGRLTYKGGAFLKQPTRSLYFKNVLIAVIKGDNKVYLSDNHSHRERLETILVVRWSSMLKGKQVQDTKL